MSTGNKIINNYIFSNHTCVPYVKPVSGVLLVIVFYFNGFVSERKRQVVVEQTQFLSTLFFCSEFKLENIYSGVNFCGKSVAVIDFYGN